MKNYFNSEETQLMTHITVLKDLMGVTDLMAEPCPRLIQQLNELTVLNKLLQEKLQQLTEQLTQ